MTYTAVATDSFTGTALSVIDSGVWTQVRDVGFGSTIRYSTPTGKAVGRFASTASSATGLAHACAYVRAADTYAQDQYVTITVGGLGANWGLPVKLGAILRATTAQDTSMSCYLAYVCGNSNLGANNVCIVKTNGTTDGTSLVNVTPTLAWADNDTFTFEALGGSTTTLNCYRNGTAISGATYSDSSSPLTTANRPGIFIAGDDSVSGSETVYIFDWEGGNVTSGAAAGIATRKLLLHVGA